MVKEIVHDPIFLARHAQDATPEDLSIADDLLDTLRAHAQHCVGMAANMIGEARRIIVFDDDGVYREMFNPVIISAQDPFTTEEGCLSLSGTRTVKRYRKIKVRWQNRSFQTRLQTFSGWSAQIIQHEIDHTQGILI